MNCCRRIQEKRSLPRMQVEVTLLSQRNQMWEGELVWEWNSRQPERSLYPESTVLVLSWLAPFRSPGSRVLALNRLKRFRSPRSRELDSQARPPGLSQFHQRRA